MNQRAIISVVILVVAAALTGSAATFNVTSTGDGAVLSNAIIGTGITLVGTPVVAGDPSQSGTFTNFDSGPYTQTDGTTGRYMVQSGIILTSGVAQGATGNFVGGADNLIGTPGDPDLTALSGSPTFDANSITFTFTSDRPTVYLNFTFASTEYPSSVGSRYNDVFGFFINGVNVGMVPGTMTPVDINSVNADVNSQYFTQYSNGSTPFNYGGATTLLQARATVSTTNVNTVKLAIADSSDPFFDSAVLIAGGSFSTTPTPEPATMALIGSGMVALSIVARRRMRR